jgi:hypothetical protein
MSLAVGPVPVMHPEDLLVRTTEPSFRPIAAVSEFSETDSSDEEVARKTDTATAVLHFKTASAMTMMSMPHLFHLPSEGVVEPIAMQKILPYDSYLRNSRTLVQALRESLGEGDQMPLTESRKFIWDYCGLMDRELSRLEEKYSSCYDQCLALREDMIAIITEVMEMPDGVSQAELHERLDRVEGWCVRVRDKARELQLREEGIEKDKGIITERIKDQLDCSALFFVPSIDRHFAFRSRTLTCELTLNAESDRRDIALLEGFMRTHSDILELQDRYLFSLWYGLGKIDHSFCTPMLESCRIAREEAARLPAAEHSLVSIEKTQTWARKPRANSYVEG